MFGGRIGIGELLVILAIAVLLFGNRLPGVGKSLGEGLRNFKKGLKAGEDETAGEAKEPAENVQTATPPKGQQILASPIATSHLASPSNGASNSSHQSEKIVDAEHKSNS